MTRKILALYIFTAVLIAGNLFAQRAPQLCQRCREPQAPSQVTICSPVIGATSVKPEDVTKVDGGQVDKPCPPSSPKAIAVELGKLKLSLTNPPSWAVIVIIVVFIIAGILMLVGVTKKIPNARLKWLGVSALVGGLAFGAIGGFWVKTAQVQDELETARKSAEGSTPVQIENDIEIARLKTENEILRSNLGEGKSRLTEAHDSSEILTATYSGTIILALMAGWVFLTRELLRQHEERPSSKASTVKRRRGTESPEKNI